MAEALDPLRAPGTASLTSDPERSDVSVLAETHTADTAPATLPEPLPDEPATSSPLPPSDVFPRSLSPAPGELELPLAPLDTPAVPDSAPRSLLGAPTRPRGPYWEWALLGFSGTLLVVAMVLRQSGLPLFSAGLAQPAPLVVSHHAPLRPRPSAPSPAVPAPLPEPAPVSAPLAAPPAASAAARKPALKRKPRRAKATPAAPEKAAPPPRPQLVPARDSVRAGLAQELP